MMLGATVIHNSDCQRIESRIAGRVSNAITTLKSAAGKPSGKIGTVECPRCHKRVNPRFLSAACDSMLHG